MVTKRWGLEWEQNIRELWKWNIRENTGNRTVNIGNRILGGTLGTIKKALFQY